MKILCLSDMVLPQMESAANLRRHYNDVEIIISCGDMPVPYLEFITSVLNVPLYYVRGNHDERYEETPPGGTDLHEKVLTYRGITLSGLEGSMRYNRGKIQYSEGEMMRKVLRAAPRLGLRRWRRGSGVDIFVAHSPPRGIHDAPDLPHTGFRAFLQYLRWYRPRYMLHGHVHTWDRRNIVETQVYDTRVLNINPVKVIEIEALCRK